MRSVPILVVAAVALATTAGAATKCPPDSVKVGSGCVDKYEESVWQIPVTKASLGKKIQAGKATPADLRAAGAVQLGCTDPPFNLNAYPSEFPANAQWKAVVGSKPPSPEVYAVSVPGVLPTTCTTWFQAAQACTLAGKHLASNREWQDAATGTPDGAPCVVNATGPANTGANPGCVSNWGAFDMVGNVAEWVADWVPASSGCLGWGAFSDDTMCLTGVDTVATGPGALIRGSAWFNGTGAGVFSVFATSQPSTSLNLFGFRCVR